MSHDEPDGDLRTSAAIRKAADGVVVVSGGASDAPAGRSGANPSGRFVSTPDYGASMTVLAEQQATEHIHGICLKTGPPHRVGVELEWLPRAARGSAPPGGGGPGRGGGGGG